MCTRRLFIITSIIFFVSSSTNAGAKIKQKIFYEPSRNMSFKMPQGEWRMKIGFGNEIATFFGQNNAKIKIMSVLPVKEKSKIDDIAKSIIEENPDSHMVSDIQESNLGGRIVKIVSFKNSNGMTGLLIAVPTPKEDIHIVCADAAASFVKTFLTCRELAESISFKKPLQPATNFAASVKHVIDRANFAWLDGRAGCAGVSDEPRRMAGLAAEEGNFESARILSEIASTLEDGKDVTNILNLKFNQEFFSELALARTALEEGSSEKAQQFIKRAASNSYEDISDSHLFIALNVWLKRIDDNLASAKYFFDLMGNEICGTSGAIAAHEFGLAMSRKDPGQAILLFEQAISADRSYAPAYISLCRALLDKGDPANVAFARIRGLLALAPDLPKIRDMIMRLDDMHQQLK